MSGKKTILIEGWRFLPHSYAVVNAFQCLELLLRADVELFHHDVAYFQPNWKSHRGLLSQEAEALIGSIPALPAGRKPDAILRIAFPYNLAPASIENLLVFGTAEACCVPNIYTARGQSLAAALEQNPRVKIVTPSNWSRQGFIRSGARPEQVYLVPHGADPSIFHPMDEPQRQAVRQQSGWDGFMFLSIGAMTKNKGLAHLFRAFAAVAERHPQVQLVLKGMDALYKSKDLLLESTSEITDAERAILAPRLHYRGETLDFAQIAMMYQLADAYVSPYYSEGFNMPVLEAAASGLPVICTAGGSTDDFTRDEFALRIPSTVSSGRMNDVQGTMLIPDTTALANHMLAVIENPALRARAREAGPAFVREHFTWKHAVDQLLAAMFT